MYLNREQVEHIAELAKLELTPEEIERFGGQLSAILDYAARLNAVDTTGIPPTSSVLPPHATLRPDIPAASLDIEETLRNAPQREGDQFRVPPVQDK